MWDRTPFRGAIAVILIAGFVLTHLAIRANVPAFSKDIGALDTLVSVLTLLGATWAVWLLYVRTKHSDESVRLAQKTFENSEKAELAVRFAKAIELLDSENEATRVGGILMLRDVARGSPTAYYDTVREILAAFIERHCREDRMAFEQYVQPPENREDYQVTEEELYHWEEAVPPDIEVSNGEIIKAVEVFGDPFHMATSDPRQSTPIKGLVLMRADLAGLRLSNVVFRDCYFIATRFETCDFVGSVFRGALMGEINFIDCNLERFSLLARKKGERRNYVAVSVWNSDAGNATLNASQLSLHRSDVSGLHATADRWQERDCWYWQDAPAISQKGEEIQSTAFDRAGLEPTRRTERGMRMYARPTTKTEERKAR
jgi:hypothetical protein